MPRCATVSEVITPVGEKGNEQLTAVAAMAGKECITSITYPADFSMASEITDHISASVPLVT